MKWKIRISEVGREVKELIETAKQFDLVIDCNKAERYERLYRSF